jgi:hypothetical protein
VGNEEIKRELKIGTLITPKEREGLITLLRDYVDVFDWSYKNMPGLYRVPLVEGCKSVKQRLRRTNLNVLIKVKAKIEKQWNADFLKVVKYPQWVSNIVVVPKKEDKIRVWTLRTKTRLALKIIFLYHTWMYWSIHIFLYGWIFGLQLYENGARG